jgi:hypothetical protein
MFKRWLSSFQGTADSSQHDNELFYYAVRCSLPCAFCRKRVTLYDVPFRQVQDDPESFRYIQLSSSGVAYLFVSDRAMRCNLSHLTEPSYGVADNPGTLREPIFAFCCAPDCAVLMTTPQPEQAEQGAVLAPYVVARVAKLYRVHRRSPVSSCVRDHALLHLNR